MADSGESGLRSGGNAGVVGVGGPKGWPGGGHLGLGGDTLSGQLGVSPCGAFKCVLFTCAWGGVLVWGTVRAGCECE